MIRQVHALIAGRRVVLRAVGALGIATIAILGIDPASACDRATCTHAERGSSPRRTPSSADTRVCPMGGQMPVVPFPEADLPDPTSGGARAFTRFCDQCHALPSPRAHAATAWDASIDRMVGRMRMMEAEKGAPWGAWMPNIAAPSDAEVESIRSYLRSNAMKVAPEGLTGGDDAGGLAAFSKVCSQCHALPDPAQHSDAEWPGVVARMLQNMDRMGVKPPEDEVLEQITTFLTGHAAP